MQYLPRTCMLSMTSSTAYVIVATIPIPWESMCSMCNIATMWCTIILPTDAHPYPSVHTRREHVQYVVGMVSTMLSRYVGDVVRMVAYPTHKDVCYIVVSRGYVPSSTIPRPWRACVACTGCMYHYAYILCIFCTYSYIPTIACITNVVSGYVACSADTQWMWYVWQHNPRIRIYATLRTYTIPTNLIPLGYQ